MQRAKSGFKNLSITLLFSFALFIRLSGNDFGFPYFFHPDETKLVSIAWNMSAEKSLNPHNFFYPTGFIYLLYSGYKVISFLGLNFSDPHADLIILHWLGRFYSAIFGAGAVIVVFAIARAAFGFLPGIASSIFLCFNFIHLRHSHYGTTDATSLFFILTALFLLMTSYDEKKLGMISIAAFLAGIATGMKYSAWPVILPLMFMMLKIRFWQRIEMLVFFLSGFLLTTPFALIDFKNFISSLIEVLIIPRSKWLGITHADPFFYFSNFRPVAGIGIIFVFTIIGLFSRIKKWSGKDTLLASFFIPYIILSSLSIEKIDRFFLPAIVIFILWAGLGLTNTAIVLARLRVKACAIFIILIVIFSIKPILTALSYIKILNGTDNRTIASKWITGNVRHGSTLAVFSHPWANPAIEGMDYKIIPIPLVYKNKDIDREKFKLRLAKNAFIVNIAQRLFKKDFSPGIFEHRLSRMTSLEEFTLQPLKYFMDAGADYIIISGFFREDLLSKDTAGYFPGLYASSYVFFRELERKAEMVYNLKGVEGFGRDFAVSPSVEIYKIRR